MDKALNLLWEASRHVLAVIVTALALSAIPVVAAFTVGVLGMIVGVALTILLTMGADPPIFGFIFGVVVTLTSAMVALVLPLLVLLLAHLLTGAVVMPFILFIDSVFKYWHIRSRLLAAAVYLAAGTGIGIGLGALAHFVATATRPQIVENSWFVLISYALGLLVGIVAVFVYLAILFGADAVRNIIRGVASVVVSRRRPIPAQH